MLEVLNFVVLYF